eukprot:scaffold62177_cov19-Tisochrysis_lutea.AAC.1
MQTRVLALPSGTYPVSQLKSCAKSSNAAQAPSTIKNMHSASNGILALYVPECQHMDNALHILSGCKCPFIRNTVGEHHSIANKMILNVASKGSYESRLIHTNVGSADYLAQHDLHIIEQVSTRVIPPYLFGPSIPDQARRTFSRPDAIL